MGVSICETVGEGAGLDNLVVVVEIDRSGLIIKGDGGMVPGIDVVNAVAIVEPIGRIVIAGSHSVAKVGIDPDALIVGNVGAANGAEDKVDVFVDPDFVGAIWSCCPRSVPAGAEAAVGLVGAMVEVDFPDE